ncbi:hypothetical protein [Pseudofrankia sp. BMG5.36]|uniref:hypothetical protein n=1 Tax=Pseudofrankia sp. BMG5.36 TaxID=1834512 RepID=UPI0008DAA288|nr:hypothetical protein [Pseudofrankia sp. BMG5.36]OHV58097.1 hypothetical protein BCD48_06405 [Pseudofrankia sp. BMG5.36]
MLIDCDSCVARGDACEDCVLSVLLAPPPVVEWDEDERRALALLADAGLLPRLRLVTPLDVVPADGGAAAEVPTAQQMIPLPEPFAVGPRRRSPNLPDAASPIRQGPLARRPDAAGPRRRSRRAG